MSLVAPEQEETQPLLVIVGPTATGKSTLAARLAHELEGEVISADSVQVYKYFDIGSGKPGAEELGLCAHHLIDIAEPLETLEANVWAELAGRRIDEVRARGAIPVVCGGTFLWVRALIYGLAEAPPADRKIRERHKLRAEKEGRGRLHEELARVDPLSSARLHPNDLVRVSRALEVFELTGTPLSALQAEHGFKSPRHDARLISVTWDPAQYEARLRARILDMFAQGWRAEVEQLLARGFEQARAMDAVGYRQVRDAVLGAEEVSDDELFERVTRVTRVFARRQRTWLRDEPQTAVPNSALEDPAALQDLARKVFSLTEDKSLLQRAREAVRSI